MFFHSVLSLFLKAGDVTYAEVNVQAKQLITTGGSLFIQHCSHYGVSWLCNIILYILSVCEMNLCYHHFNEIFLNRSLKLDHVFIQWLYKGGNAKSQVKNQECQVKNANVILKV